MKIKKSKNQSYEDLILQGVSYNNFINAIRSPATRNSEISIKRYMNHLKITSTDDLLRPELSKPRLIESQIIDYIMSTTGRRLLFNYKIPGSTGIYILPVK